MDLIISEVLKELSGAFQILDKQTDALLILIRNPPYFSA